MFRWFFLYILGERKKSNNQTHIFNIYVKQQSVGVGIDLFSAYLNSIFENIIFMF